MKPRNKILSQILIIANQYDIEILSIDFRNNTSSYEIKLKFKIKNDEIKLKYKIVNDEFIVKYLYTKNDKIEVNKFINYFNEKLCEILKEDK